MKISIAKITNFTLTLTNVDEMLNKAFETLKYDPAVEIVKLSINLPMPQIDIDISLCKEDLWNEESNKEEIKELIKTKHNSLEVTYVDFPDGCRYKVSPYWSFEDIQKIFKNSPFEHFNISLEGEKNGDTWNVKSAN